MYIPRTCTSAFDYCNFLKISIYLLKIIRNHIKRRNVFNIISICMHLSSNKCKFEKVPKDIRCERSQKQGNFEKKNTLNKQNICNSACQQRTLTPPDTWSCPTLGLASVLMLRPISPELVLFLDF